MIAPEKKYYEWIALLAVSLIGMAVSLYGYYQIVNIPPPTSLDIKKTPKIIFIFNPKANSEIKNPVEISGRVAIPEKTIKMRIKDRNEKILKEIFLPASISALEKFNASFSYKTPTTKTGLIQFFEYSEEDDFEIGKRTIPVSFSEFK